MVELTKSDFWRAGAVGEAIAILSLPAIKNLNLFNLSYVFLALWLLFLPAVAVSGFYFIYLFSRGRPALLELGKYGLVGCLNFFLDAGIFNFFILTTGIANGWLADVFITIAFVVTATQSFFWNKFWIFGSTGSGRHKIEYVKFFSITITTSLLGLSLCILLSIL